MRKIFLFAVLMLVLKFSQAQYSLAFCESISGDDKPQNISNTFFVYGNGKALKFFVKADEGFDTDQVKFTIYYINGMGNEEEIQSMSQSVEPEWNYIWKEVTLFNPGTYRVKVYTDKGTYLTSANVFIKAR